MQILAKWPLWYMLISKLTPLEVFSTSATGSLSRILHREKYDEKKLQSGNSPAILRPRLGLPLRRCTFSFGGRPALDSAGASSPRCGRWLLSPETMPSSLVVVCRHLAPPRIVRWCWWWLYSGVSRILLDFLFSTLLLFQAFLTLVDSTLRLLIETFDWKRKSFWFVSKRLYGLLLLKTKAVVLNSITFRSRHGGALWTMPVFGVFPVVIRLVAPAMTCKSLKTDGFFAWHVYHLCRAFNTWPSHANL